MFTYAFPRPSVTATIVPLIKQNGLYRYVLLGKRIVSSQAFPNHFCLPGGFLDARIDKHDSTNNITNEGETIEQTAIREMFEETSLKITKLKLFHVHSDPTTDPRCHVVNICYMTSISYDDYLKYAKPNDDLSELKLFSICDEITEPVAFNHKDIINIAKEKIG